MNSTATVKRILDNYASEPPGVRASLHRILMQGRLGGTGKLVILPVDQGFEHGPVRSFAANPPAYDPVYHYSLAVDAGLSAYAAPLGMLACGAETFAGQIPTILKMNSSNALHPAISPKDQAITASIGDALRLGCSAIGFTVYPGSSAGLGMFEEISALRAEASSVGLATVIWSYPRGEGLAKEDESALDVSAYAAQIAALLGAHIIKIKLPSGRFSPMAPASLRNGKGLNLEDADSRVSFCMNAAFAGRRIVVFSGGASKGTDSVLADARAIHRGGGNGSIIGRNSFQRPRGDALGLLSDIIAIYQGDSD